MKSSPASDCNEPFPSREKFLHTGVHDVLAKIQAEVQFFLENLGFNCPFSKLIILKF